jgi:hypothetical protein
VGIKFTVNKFQDLNIFRTPSYKQKNSKFINYVLNKWWNKDVFNDRCKNNWKHSSLIHYIGCCERITAA